MPGKQVKNWSMYHKLRRKGMSKQQAAITTNHTMKHRKKRRSKS